MLAAEAATRTDVLILGDRRARRCIGVAVSK